MGAAERIEVVRADITTQDVDAVVNAANGRLANGAGVAGAISAAAGPELQRACDALVAERGPLDVGEAVATDAFRMRCRALIHAVGPVYGRHGGREASLLAAAHRSALAVALELEMASIAFPAISCGIYGYPVEEAAPIAVSTAAAAIESGAEVSVRFCLFGDREQSAYESARAAV